MRMNPPEHHEILGITVIEELRLVDGFTSVRSALLVWDDKLGDEECIGDDRSTEDPARLKVGAGVCGSNREKLRTKVWGKEDSSKRLPILKIGRRLESEG